MAEHEHSPEAIKERLAAGPRHSYLRDWIYGGIDGAVTTFAVVAGVVGAQLSTKIILIIGLANIIADGFSMAAGNYLATKSEQDEIERLVAVENRHIEKFPEGEREEVRQIFKEKGFEGEDLRRVVELMTADKERWVRTMITEEYGLPQEVRSARTGRREHVQRIPGVRACAASALPGWRAQLFRAFGGPYGGGLFRHRLV